MNEIDDMFYKACKKHLGVTDEHDLAGRRYDDLFKELVTKLQKDLDKAVKCLEYVVSESGTSTNYNCRSRACLKELRGDNE